MRLKFSRWTSGSLGLKTVSDKVVTTTATVKKMIIVTPQKILRLLRLAIMILLVFQPNNLMGLISLSEALIIHSCSVKKKKKNDVHKIRRKIRLFVLC